MCASRGTLASHPLCCHKLAGVKTQIGSLLLHVLQPILLQATAKLPPCCCRTRCWQYQTVMIRPGTPLFTSAPHKKSLTSQCTMSWHRAPARTAASVLQFCGRFQSHHDHCALGYVCGKNLHYVSCFQSICVLGGYTCAWACPRTSQLSKQH